LHFVFFDRLPMASLTISDGRLLYEDFRYDSNGKTQAQDADPDLRTKLIET
jgi:hypothetical protein